MLRACVPIAIFILTSRPDTASRPSPSNRRLSATGTVQTFAALKAVCGASSMTTAYQPVVLGETLRRWKWRLTPGIRCSLDAGGMVFEVKQGAIDRCRNGHYSLAPAEGQQALPK